MSTKLQTGINVSDIYMPLSSSWQSYAQTDWLEELSDVYEAKPDEGSDRTVFEKMGSAWQDYCIAENRGVPGEICLPLDGKHFGNRV